MKVFLTVFIFISCTQLFAQQTLKIGVVPNNPPFSMQNTMNGNYDGFEVSIMNEICQRIKAKCIYIPKLFDKLFTAVENKEIDLAIGTISITPIREQQYLFSLPYLASKGIIIVANDKYKKPSDLMSKNFGVIEGTIFVNVIKADFGEDSAITTSRYPLDMLRKLVEGDTDAVLVDKGTGKYWLTSHPRVRQIGNDIVTGNGYAFMTYKGNTQIIDEINQALTQMEDDGTYLKIFNSYFNPNFKNLQKPTNQVTE